MSQELRMLSNVPIVTIDWETRHDYHDLRFSIFIVSAFVSSVQELQCLSWSNTYPPHVLVDSGSYLSWFGCGSLSPTETWVKQIFLFLPMHCNWNLLFCWPSNSALRIPYIFCGESQIWVGGVADSQTRSTPPKITLFWPGFHLLCSQMWQEPWSGWVVSQIWENFKKKTFFFTFPKKKELFKRRLLFCVRRNFSTPGDNGSNGSELPPSSPSSRPPLLPQSGPG